MKYPLMQAKTIDFEQFGFETMLECGDEGRARDICAQHILAYERGLQPELSSIISHIQEKKNRGAALHGHLYDRPIPVNDAAMLVCSKRVLITLALAVLAAIACFAGNTTTFYLFGFGLPLTLLLAAGTTALPIVVGHSVYEKILAHHKGLHALVIVAAMALCAGGILELAQARQNMVDKAAATPATASYVDEGPADDTPDPAPKPEEGSESTIRQTFGKAMLLIMISADLMLGYLIGVLTRMHTEEDYAAWQHLKKIARLVAELQKKGDKLVASVEIAKRHCMAGILRALNIKAKRRIPYHRALTMLVLLGLLVARHLQAQAIDHYEGTLIDTSGSISRGGTSSELFHEYLISTRRLLSTEPANSRVWVSSISTDSFGGVHEVLKGWTPDARGIFTYDLDHARHELASSFAAKSSGMAPVATGTDIIGGLWHMKAMFESGPPSDASHEVSKTIWIFSDMMNETHNFPMPALLEIGPAEMLERAKARGLLVPLNGYKIYVYGASPSGLTPQGWNTIKTFWTMYFSATGAELVSYSAECDAQR